MGYIYNSFLNELDYFEGANDIGLSIPQPYIATPTLTNLRDMLIAAGIMAAAPPPPPSVEPITWEDEGVAWEDEGIVHEDT